MASRYVSYRTGGNISRFAPSGASVNKRNQKGFTHLAIMVIVSALLIWASVTVASIRPASADNTSSLEIRSGQYGYCINVANPKPTKAINVGVAECNGQAGQNFSFDGTHIKNPDGFCLSAAKSAVMLESCNSSNISQDWSSDSTGLLNVQTNNCLSLEHNKTNLPLVTASCNNLDTLAENWTPDNWPGKPLAEMSDPSCTQSSLRERLACNAETQWLSWQTDPKLHAALLYDYTDGNPAEEWCADFVSYIYQESGAPFSSGERGVNGWDEYDANNIINQSGLVYHAANSGYLPRPGDIAYFNYAGGHVELVVSGGSHPTFIYGDSGTIDPVTGNGNMAENQIESNGSAGQLLYYLSPTN